MNRETLQDVLSFISDEYVAAAAKPQKKKPALPWVGIIAAVLVLALMLNILRTPFSGSQDPTGDILQNPTNAAEETTAATDETITTAAPTMTPSPQLQFLAAAPVYPKQEQHDQPAGYAEGLDDFLIRSSQEFLSGEGNQLYSPLSAYINLAMLAECAEGNSRKQILELLGSDSIEALRTQAGHVWNAHYSHNAMTSSLLATSLWIADRIGTNSTTIQTLADSYYTSVFRGDLASTEMNEALRSWLNDQTGGLLQEQINNLEMDHETAVALASAVYFQTGWSNAFKEENSFQGTFHGASGSSTAIFMYQELDDYYHGNGFGAAALTLKSGGKMWLILPEEGKTPAEVLQDGTSLQMTLSNGEEGAQHYNVQVNLSLPKFDVSVQQDLIQGLKNLGVTDIFDFLAADFSALTEAFHPLKVSKFNHPVRIFIDENGISGAAYTQVELIEGEGLYTQYIDFTLDRPFLFVITSQDGLPVFTGVVNDLCS